jgi:dipeptidyl aminopeptidase/acylaminoacyl peptidase
MHPINKNTLNCFARTNETLMTKPIRGVILEFPGLGGGSCLGGVDDIGVYDTPYSRECAEQGFFLAYAFTGPWAWMNSGAVRYADALVEAIYDRFSLPDSTPMIYTGGSMGGQSALIFTGNARRKPVACAVNGPACDMLDIYLNDYFKRSVFSAVSYYDLPFEEALKSISPLYRTENMPKIPYFIVHCDKDEAIDIDKHAVAWVNAMRSKGHDVTYLVVPDRNHCDITPEARRIFNQFIYDHLATR